MITRSVIGPSTRSFQAYRRMNTYFCRFPIYIVIFPFFCNYHAVLKSDEIKASLKRLGAVTVGISGAEARPDIVQMIEEQGRKGNLAGMEWLINTAILRGNPGLHLNAARSVIVSAWPYTHTPSNDPIALFAQGPDYHETISRKMKEAWAETFPDEKEVRYFVDSGALAEKPFAEKCGIGWIGKNSLVINRDHGSFFNLGVILTRLSIKEDLVIKNGCGTCTRCIEACPTKAIDPSGSIDCRKCISYLTIEYKGEIPIELRPHMGTKIFGCDDCQIACPYNVATQHYNRKKEGNQIELLGNLMSLDKSSFKKKFLSSPVLRIGRERFLRNVAVALGNTLDKNALNFLGVGLQEKNILIRSHCEWAIHQISAHFS